MERKMQPDGQIRRSRGGADKLSRHVASLSAESSWRGGLQAATTGKWPHRVTQHYAHMNCTSTFLID